MKILHINTSDTYGGAAIAALRLHKAMLANGMDSTFFCLNRTINDDERILTVDRRTKLKSRIFGIAKQLLFRKLKLSNVGGLFSNMRFGYKSGKFIKLDDYDMIYIHWVNNAFLSFKGLEEICKTGKKVFWFMHDMFPITGGCHCSFGCDGYRVDCGNCEYLKHPAKCDFSYKQLKIKKKILNKYKNISFVAPSRWLCSCAEESALGKFHDVHYISNLLDSNVFKVLPKDVCRKALNIPSEKKVILFGADSALTNPYKGFGYLVEALGLLRQDSAVDEKEILLVIFGSSYNKEIAQLLPFETLFMGYLQDSCTLSLLYNCADVFCMPSLAEAFGNVALESVHCHTPVVGFDVGGIPDIVNQNTGYLAEYKNAQDLANGIKSVLAGKIKPEFKGIQKFSAGEVLKKHKALYGKGEK